MDATPETFVDAFGEVSFKHGMIRIELVSLSGSEPRVMQRLIMSLQGFSQMLQAQNNILERLERAGVIRPVEPPPGAEPAPERGGVGAAVPQPASTPAPVSEPALRPAQERGPPKSPETALQCLVAVARHHGIDLSIERIKHDYALKPDDDITRQLPKIARNSGMRSRKLQVGWKDL